MKNVLKIVLIALVGFSSLSLSAQDIHYSQFYMAPLDLNPALTGVMNCNVRFVGNYRNQWASVLKSNAYNTYSVSYDQKIPVARSDYFGVGGMLWSDVAGSLDFQTVKGQLSASYSKHMGGYRHKSHYLVVGADLGLSQRSIDFLKARWGNQHDNNGGFDGGLPHFENDFYNRDNFMFGDVAAGLMWFSILNEDNNVYVGAAFRHLNQANQSFDDNEFVPYYTKMTMHAGGQFRVSDRVSLIPGVVTFFQGPSFELNGGTSARFILGNSRLADQTFQIGAWARIANHYEDPITADAVIVSTRFDYGNYGIGFSYDINISSLKQASNSNGAFEFSLIYNICGPESRGVYCPRF